MDTRTDSRRRLILRVLLKCMAAVAAVAIAATFLAYSTGSKQASSEVTRASLVGLKLNGARRLDWDGRSVWLVRRKSLVVSALPPAEDGDWAPLPAGVNRYHRGLQREYLVVLAKGAECEVVWREGGFVEPCNGRRYDISGRPEAGEGRPLTVPPHRIVGADVIIGQEMR
ncbi:MAG: hypothetical protein ACQES2_10830 [Pseudomonadota bacterium]